MRFFNFFSAMAFLFIALFVAACTTSSVTPPTGPPPKEPPPDKTVSFEGSFSKAGLEGIKVNHFNLFKDSIYASTDHGLYEKTPGSTSWIPRGLQQDSVTDVAFLRGNKLLADVHHKYIDSGRATLYLSTDHGQTWQPFLNNFGGKDGKYTYLGSLTTMPIPSDTLLAHAADRTVARSTNGGQSWEILTGQWDAFGGAQEAIRVDPYHPDIIWAAGASVFKLPYLLRSTDDGKTWENLDNVGSKSEICYDVVSHPVHEQMIVSALLFEIRKSIDNGKNWKTVLENINAFTLARSLRSSEAVYTSGRNAKGTLFFAASTDFGNTWQTIEMENSPDDVSVYDLASVMQDGHEVLYLATKKGVYSYTFEQ